jgi:pimeloyl-ACP methyl ester carboxylesterase
VLLHGFTDSWRSWSPIQPAIERFHDVLAIALPGHADASPTGSSFKPSVGGVTRALEQELDAAGIATAHIVGSSLGGWLAFELAARGRARSVVAFAPAGGWPVGGRDQARVDRFFRLTEDPAACSLTHEYLEEMQAGFFAQLGAIDIPTRIVWSAGDRLIRWPRCYERFRTLIPHADVVEIRGVGHRPMADNPAMTARLILEMTAQVDQATTRLLKAA